MKTLKSLSNGYLYQTYDKVINLTSKMIELSQSADVLGEEELSDNLSLINRRYSFPLKNKVMEYYNSNKVVLLYSAKDVRLPTTIPAYLMNNGNRILCCVNLSNNTRKNKKGEYEIDAKILYSYMQAGTLLSLSYEKYQSIVNKSNIIKLGSSIYCKLFTKVVNKMFTLNVTPIKIDVINFLSSWFFIYNLMGRDAESLQDINKRYALENCKSTSKLAVETYMDAFDPETDFKNIDTFITALSKNVPGLEEITTRAFVDQYILSYGPTMMLGLEYLPILLANVGYVSVGAFLNNQHSLENILDGDGEKILKEFANL